MKKELLTGALVAGVALTGAARPHWGHGGRHFWPGFAGGAIGAFTAHAISDAMWASRGYLPVRSGWYGYGYGVAVPAYGYTVAAPAVTVAAPAVSYTVAAPASYTVAAPATGYTVAAPRVQQAPVAQPVQQPAPQPQEVRIVVEHQYPAQATQQATQNNQQQQRQ